MDFSPVGRIARFRKPTRRWGLTVLAVVTCGAVGACSAAGTPHGRPDYSHKATDAIRAMRSAGTEDLTFDIELNSGGSGLTFTGNEQLEYYGKQHDSASSVTTERSGADESTSRTEIVTIGDTVYRKVDGRHAGEPWQRFDVGHWSSATPSASPGSKNQGASGATALDPALSAASMFDPVRYLTLAADITAAPGGGYIPGGSRERVNNTMATRYDVQCATGNDPHCRLSDLGPGLGDLPGDGSVTMTFWLDDLSRPRKVALTLVLEPSGGFPITVKATLTADQFGAPSGIEAPPASETTTCRRAC
ncbi:MAG: hypothetical protein WCA46_18770 [Actinocatenispora sp.]